VAGLPVPLAGLRRTAEPVWSTRLQTFLTVLNFHPLSGYNWSSPCSPYVCIQYSKFDTVITMGRRGKINAILRNIKINVQKLADFYADMNCQQICKISCKRLNRSENIPKRFRGSYFFETPCIVIYFTNWSWNTRGAYDIQLFNSESSPQHNMHC